MEFVVVSPFVLYGSFLVAYKIMVGEFFYTVRNVQCDGPVGITFYCQDRGFGIVAVAKGWDIAGNIYGFSPVGAVVDIEC